MRVAEECLASAFERVSMQHLAHAALLNWKVSGRLHHQRGL